MRYAAFGLLVAAIGLALSRPAAGQGPEWDPKATRTYLDGRGDWWTSWPSAARGQGTFCVSCHTAVPYAVVRPALAKGPGGVPVPAGHDRILTSVRTRVEKWDELLSVDPEGKDPLATFYGGAKRESALDTESVLNALVLVANDPRAGGALGALTAKALDHMWARQRLTGDFKDAWDWLDFGLRPWEKDGAYFGATLAAVAAGSAGDLYPRRGTAEVRDRETALRGYLKTNAGATSYIHYRALGLWADSHLKGVFTDDERKRLIDDLFGVQRADGGWGSGDFGKKSPEAAAGGWTIVKAYPDGATSDGYATGLAVLALKRSGVPATDDRLKKGVAWLVSQQAADGTWPAVYLNRDRDPASNVGKFMRDAGAAFAALALTEGQ